MSEQHEHQHQHQQQNANIITMDYINCQNSQEEFGKYVNIVVQDCLDKI